MDFVYDHTHYSLRLVQPIINLDNLYPESPHVLVQVKIFLLIEHRFLDNLPDGSTTELQYSLNPVEERLCTFDLRNLVGNSRGTCITLSETLSTLEIEQQYFDQIIGVIVSYGVVMHNHLGNRGRKILPLNLHIRKRQDVYFHYDRSLMDTALRDSEAEFERENYGMVPARRSALGRLLKRVKIEGENHPRKRRRTSESQQNCTICMEEFAVGSDSISMPCSHLFHGGCIFKWLKQSHYCPVCRHEMPT